MKKHINGITQALVVAGSRAAMARDMGVTRQAIQNWMRYGYAPLHRLAELEARYGVPRELLINPRLLSETSPIHFDDLTEGE